MSSFFEKNGTFRINEAIFIDRNHLHPYLLILRTAEVLRLLKLIIIRKSRGKRLLVVLRLFLGYLVDQTKVGHLEDLVYIAASMQSDFLFRLSLSKTTLSRFLNELTIILERLSGRPGQEKKEFFLDTLKNPTYFELLMLLPSAQN